jgi:antitoxin component of RelBE/YafQ-DinJ toxin-antitoxin module
MAENKMADISVEVDKGLYEEASKILREQYDVSVETAFVWFAKACIKDKGLLETLYLESIPGMTEQLKEGMKTPISECVTLDSLFENYDGTNQCQENDTGKPVGKEV